MKLLCTVPLRAKDKKTGKQDVEFAGPSGKKYLFELKSYNDEGDKGLVCDVTDEIDVGHALKTGNFEPVDELDFDKANEILDSFEDEDDEEEVQTSKPALIEAGTKPSGRKPKKAGK